ncbi:MAG: hypothetical protein KGO53_12530 [Alphaproteobacteria bacterium]|nr:hypothetical protein [Alphaproteobacteria bacterium]
MLRILFALALVLASASGARAACVASAMRPWGGLVIEAKAHGASCPKAVVSLVVRNGAKVLWKQAAPASSLMIFTQNPPANGNAMIKALKQWISSDGFAQTTDKLKTSGEFPFEPDAALDPQAFKKLRQARLPVFCYVQGMESARCLGLRVDGAVIDLGVQLFPG